MAASIKNILIGVFVLTAIGIIIFMLLFLHPSVGDNAKTLRVRFTDIDKVNIGTRVTYAGKPMGEVVEINEIADSRTSRKSVHGNIYVYELVLKVDSGVDVFNTDNVILRTSGLLGERNIEINPRPLKPGQQLKNVENQILYAEETATVEDTMKQIELLSKKFDVVLNDVHHLFGEIQKHEVVAKISHTIDNIFDISATLNQPDKWNQFVNNLHNFSTNIDTLSVNAKESLSSLDLAINDFQTAGKNAITFTENANEIINQTKLGKGTLGQLFVEDGLYLRLKSILHKGENVMDDINNYGMLFHLNKRWQRIQARRLHLLEKLNNPNEFTKFFNQELDQISASLSRVSVVLNESECYPPDLLGNCQFTTRFSELLQRVENMEESLKLYNEQIVEQEEKCSR